MERLLLLSAVCGMAALGAPAQAQVAGPGARLVGFTIEQQEPEFAQVIDLGLTIRLDPQIMVFVPDTLVPGEASVSAGPGEWTVAEGPADSVDVRARYPIMGFLNGRVELPEVELWIRPAMAGEEGGARPVSELAEASAVETSSVRRLQIPLGAIQIVPLREMAEAGNVLNPRPPADVLGGEWSAWLIAAIALSLATGAAVVWLVWSRWREISATRGLGLERLSPRLRALRDLDEIFSLQLPEEGRFPEFYNRTTGALRRYSEEYESDWGIALTSTELLGRLRDRWGPPSVESLDDAVPIAEWVKFGTYEPGIEVAEGHWRSIRDWIERVPES